MFLIPHLDGIIFKLQISPDECGLIRFFISPRVGYFQLEQTVAFRHPMVDGIGEQLIFGIIIHQYPFVVDGAPVVGNPRKGIVDTEGDILLS